ncbi:DUF3592 domain-containing protein [Streptomonospora salina]|uniref:DUF3592 domain-containing protein n=1 Tax=Streptomonospora salina TaxID=104205 RepID=A0A841E5T2_9ACTN|nr:DUF3592 domain-containing protein [Streptomonospora salina]MBB5997814.1 hypothetical protein [Streptomonospora salina]
MSVAVAVVAGLVAVFGAFGVLFTVLGLRDRRRRLRREEHGVRTQATLVAVEPAIPEERGRNEQPFVLAYADPAGNRHEHRFTHGFGGIVPAEGWQVEVLFDPQDPDNVSITGNPYLHGVDGADAAAAPAARQWLIAALAAATALLAVGGLALFAFAPVLYSPDAPAYTRSFLAGCALIFFAAAVAIAGAGTDLLMTALRKRRTAATAAGVVTQTWTEVRRGGADSADTRVHPYAVRFALPDGRQVHRRAYDTPGRDRNSPGRRVEVTYQPADPASFTVGGPGRLLRGPVLIALLGLVFAVPAAILAAVAAAV